MCHFSISTKPHPGINTFSQTTCLTVCPHRCSRPVTKSIERVTQPLTICSRRDCAPSEPPGRRPADDTQKPSCIRSLSQHAHASTCSPLPATSRARGRGQADTRSSAVSLQQATVICELATLRMSQTMRSMSGSVSAEPPGSRLIGSTSLSRWTIVGCRLVKTR